MQIGVDTHKKMHVLVVVDEHGRTGGTKTIRNSPEGWISGLQWVRD